MQFVLKGKMLTKIRHQNFSGFRIAVQRIRFNQFKMTNIKFIGLNKLHG